VGETQVEFSGRLQLCPDAPRDGIETNKLLNPHARWVMIRASTDSEVSRALQNCGLLSKAADLSTNMKSPIEALRLIISHNSTYTVRLTRGEADLQRAQALRFAVFNVELNEGLEDSHETGLDADPFDPCCDHLLVEHATSG
jgi:hypothetical protein